MRMFNENYYTINNIDVIIIMLLSGVNYYYLLFNVIHQVKTI